MEKPESSYHLLCILLQHGVNLALFVVIIEYYSIIHTNSAKNYMLGGGIDMIEAFNLSLIHI